MTNVAWTNVDGTNVSSSQLIQMALSNLDKIGLVSAEILDYIQTRTNVAWTNVDGTNVPSTKMKKINQ